MTSLRSKFAIWKKRHQPQSQGRSRRFTSIRHFLYCLLAPLFFFLLLHFIYTTLLHRHEFSNSNHKYVSYDDAEPYEAFTKRENMEKCEHPYGRVKVFISVSNESFNGHYRAAHTTLQCYLKGTDYELILVDLTNDPRVISQCSHHKDIMFLRHCALLQYLNETDWMLVMDADTGVVNPEHCIEEFIDPRVNFVFYERFFNLEVVAGIWLVRNSPFSRKFIQDWANWEFRRPNLPFGTNDNCVLHMNLLEHLFNETAPRSVQMCDEIWRNRSVDYWSYFAFVFCAKTMMGANRFWPGKFKILPKGQGFARDAFLTAERFSDRDFLYHGWKKQDIGLEGWRSPFEKLPDLSQCKTGSMDGWYFRRDTKVQEEAILKNLMDLESRYMKQVPPAARVIPWLEASELKDCYPNCMNSSKL